MTVSSPVRSEIVGTLRKDFNGRISVWEFTVSGDIFIAKGGFSNSRKVCKTREELRHLWSKMIGYGYTQV